MSSTEDSGPPGVRKASDEPGTEVYGAWRGPEGLLLLDGFRPDRARQLHLRAAVPEVSLLEPPTTWLRSALVDAVDRWVNLPLDDGLVLADRALAAAESGEAETASDLYARARQSLLDLVDRVERAAVPQRLRDELVRVVHVAPEHHAVRLPNEVRRPGLGDHFAVLEAEDRRRRARQLLTRTKGGEQPALVVLEVADVPVVVSPLLVPARLLDGVPVSVAREDRFEVVVPAALGVTARTPAASRLLLAATTVDGALLGLAPLRLDGDTFRGQLGSTSERGRLDAIHLFDAGSHTAPRFGVGSAERALSLTARRDAFGAERMAAALAAVGDQPGATSWLQERLQSLQLALGSRDGLPAWLDLAEPAGAGPRSADASRPLLAELALAHP